MLQWQMHRLNLDVCEKSVDVLVFGSIFGFCLIFYTFPCNYMDVYVENQCLSVVLNKDILVFTFVCIYYFQVFKVFFLFY